VEFEIFWKLEILDYKKQSFDKCGFFVGFCRLCKRKIWKTGFGGVWKVQKF
jgi:hypothetical protein